MKIKRKKLLSLIVGSLIIIAISVSVPVYFHVRNVKGTKLIEYSPILIWDDSDFVDYQFPGEGSQSNPYRIENYNITTSVTNGIYILATTKHFVIRNCLISATHIGINIENAARSTATIENCTIKGQFYGISISNSVNVTIRDSTLSDNYVGIFTSFSNQTLISNNRCVQNSVYGMRISESDNCSIENNYLKQNRYGVYLFESEFCMIKKNLCLNNDYAGIYCSFTDFSTFIENSCINNFQDGIKITKGDNCILAGNTISHNLIYGISISGSSNCLITLNNISYNLNYGIYISHTYILSKDNTIHHNAFIQNYRITENQTQAWDEGNSTWFDNINLEGNFWDNFNGSGWYLIDGPSLSYDEYPLLENPLSISLYILRLYYNYPIIVLKKGSTN
jgi:parallel beta-helix repeat protein